MARRKRKGRRRFNSKLNKVWGNALKMYSVLWTVCYEAGAEFNNRYREDAAKNNDYAFDVLIRLHARACQIGLEIQVLLENGFGAGALARWRTLHEIVVSALYLKDNGKDVVQKYHAHDVVRRYEEAKRYKKYAAKLDYEALDEEIFKGLKFERENLIKRFGINFGYPYGWAADSLGKDRPNFGDLEAAVDLSHWHLYRGLANERIHAGPGGIYFQIGLPSGNESVLIAGSSSFGLAGAGQYAAISLGLATIAVLGLGPNRIEHIVTMKMINEIVQRVQDVFIRAHERAETFEVRTVG